MQEGWLRPLLGHPLSSQQAPSDHRLGDGKQVGSGISGRGGSLVAGVLGTALEPDEQNFGPMHMPGQVCCWGALGSGWLLAARAAGAV